MPNYISNNKFYLLSNYQLNRLLCAFTYSYFINYLLKINNLNTLLNHIITIVFTYKYNLFYY